MTVIDQNFLEPLSFSKSDSIIDIETNYSSSVYWPDLHNAVWYMLFHDVPRRTQLNSTQLQVLLRLTQVLQYLDYPKSQTKSFLHAIENQVDLWLVNEPNGTVYIDEYTTYLNGAASKYHFGGAQEYIACSNAQDNGDNIPERHIPCSHWTLYHTLTVADYYRDPNPPDWNITKSALFLIREYTWNFFTCLHCANEFVNMSRNIEHEVHSPLESVNWLWHGHNRVNARLKNCNSDVMALPKRQFPTYVECAVCYLVVPNETDYSDIDLYTRNFNQTEITQFVLHYYNQSSILDNTV